MQEEGIGGMETMEVMTIYSFTCGMGIVGHISVLAVLKETHKFN